MLQFITNGKDVHDTITQINNVVDGGCKWVQIRMKNALQDDIIRVIEAVNMKCKDNGVVLIVDDYVEIAKRPDVDGVHLGQNDMSPLKARDILGNNKIIGLTINNIEHAYTADAMPVDYYGVGPWRYTITKEKLAPILGPSGVHKIIKYLKQSHPEREIVVIGGILVDDITEIISCGADGIAVSGALTTDQDMKTATHTFLNELTKNKTKYE